LLSCQPENTAHLHALSTAHQYVSKRFESKGLGLSGFDFACCSSREDLDYFATTKVDGHSDPEVKNRLQHVAQSGFKRITYTEAIDILLKAIQEFKPQKKGDKLFEFEVSPILKSCCKVSRT